MEPETPIEKEMGGLFWGQGPGETGVVRGREYRTACAVPLLFAMHASTARLAPCRFCVLISIAVRGEVDAVFCYFGTNPFAAGPLRIRPARLLILDQ
jgi:hypothetical protein